MVNWRENSYSSSSSSIYWRFSYCLPPSLLPPSPVFRKGRRKSSINNTRNWLVEQILSWAFDRLLEMLGIIIMPCSSRSSNTLQTFSPSLYSVTHSLTHLLVGLFGTSSSVWMTSRYLNDSNNFEKIDRRMRQSDKPSGKSSSSVRKLFVYRTPKEEEPQHEGEERVTLLRWLWRMKGASEGLEIHRFMLSKSAIF